MVEGRELGADAAAKATQRALREADDFATTGGVADMDRVGQVELRDGRREVVGIRVHVIAVPWLAHAPVPTAVMGDAAVAAGGEKHHLVFPGVGAQWPTMAEHHGLAAAPVHLAEGDSAAVAPAPGITGSAAVAPIAVPPITRSQRAATAPVDDGCPALVLSLADVGWAPVGACTVGAVTAATAVPTMRPARACRSGETYRGCHAAVCTLCHAGMSALSPCRHGLPVRAAPPPPAEHVTGCRKGRISPTRAGRHQAGVSIGTEPAFCRSSIRAPPPVATPSCRTGAAET